MSGNMSSESEQRMEVTNTYPTPPKVSCESYIKEDVARTRPGVRIVHHSAQSRDRKNSPVIPSYRPKPYASDSAPVRSGYKVVRHHAQVPPEAKSGMDNRLEAKYDRISSAARPRVVQHAGRTKFKESSGRVDSFAHGYGERYVDAVTPSSRQAFFTERKGNEDQEFRDKITKGFAAGVSKMCDDVMSIQQDRIDKLQDTMMKKMCQIGDLQKTIEGCKEDIRGLEEKLTRTVSYREAEKGYRTRKGEEVLRRGNAFAELQGENLLESPPVFKMSATEKDPVALPLSALEDHTSIMFSRSDCTAGVESHKKQKKRKVQEDSELLNSWPLPQVPDDHAQVHPASNAPETIAEDGISKTGLQWLQQDDGLAEDTQPNHILPVRQDVFRDDVPRSTRVTASAVGNESSGDAMHEAGQLNPSWGLAGDDGVHQASTVRLDRNKQDLVNASGDSTAPPPYPEEREVRGQARGMPCTAGHGAIAAIPGGERGAVAVESETNRREVSSTTVVARAVPERQVHALMLCRF